MKKFIHAVLLVVSLFGGSKLYAQVNPAISTDTSTTEGLLHYIMEPLDKSQVPTGFLAAWGAPILPMATFNGTLTDSNRIDMNLWRTLYFQLQTAYCSNGSNPMDSIIVVNNTIRQNTGDSIPIPIPLLIGQYNSVKSNAFSNNLLSYNSSQNQVHDVAGRTQSPYQLNNLFAACPNNSYTLSGTATFVCKPSLVWNNTGKSISSIQIDFDNGEGFRNITMNTPVAVSYTDTGMVRWTIKVTLSDATVLRCYSNYKVLEASSGSARYSGIFPDAVWTVSPTANYDGATIYISYTSKNRTNTMRKPLIVLEGYDVSSVAPGIQGNYSYFDFITAINEPSALYDFNYHLDNLAGYDLVFIDFDNGTDDIRRNAALVEHVIDLVNAAKATAGSTEQNVVMGLSMGGLVARYALAEMTKNNEDPETRLLITHDSPHRGANVPLGIQYLIEMAGHVNLFTYDVRDIYPQYDEAMKLLNEPATKQLLLYRATGPTAFVNNTFLDGDYRNMITFNAGDPQPAYRFIATADGSQCGHALFPPHQRLFYSNDNAFLFLWPLLSYRLRADIRAYALPVTGSTDMIARVAVSSKFKLFGFITISKQVYSSTAYAPGTQLPVDGAAGSTNPLIDIDVPHANLGFIVPPVLLGVWGALTLHVNGDPTTFCFVPTASALDVDPFNTAALSAPYVDGYNASFISRSAGYIAQEAITGGGQTTYNNTHVRFTARNAEWLYDEMEGISNTLNCSSECTPDNNFAIQGPYDFCTSATYNLSGLPDGATVSWSADPSYAVTLTPNGNQVTVTSTSHGDITLIANITSGCGNFSVTKIIWTETPNIHGYYTTNGLTYGLAPDQGLFEPYNPVCYISHPTPVQTDMDIEGASSVTWTRIYPIGTGGLLWGQSGDDLVMTFRGVNEKGIFKIDASNTCGTTTLYFSFKAKDCNTPQVLVSPNPANQTITLYLPEAEGKKPAWYTKSGRSNSPAGLIRQVAIYNPSGKLMHSQLISNNLAQIQLDVSGLSPGIYFLKISNGSHSETHKIVISR